MNTNSCRINWHFYLQILCLCNLNHIFCFQFSFSVYSNKPWSLPRNKSAMRVNWISCGCQNRSCESCLVVCKWVRGHRWSYLQLVRGWEVLIESGMTVVCCTEVWVSCCHAGGSKICWVPEGHACCKTRTEQKNKGRWVHSLKFALRVFAQECKTPD